MRRALAAAALVAAGAAAAQEPANPTLAPVVADLEYGLYCARDPLRRDPAPGTATGRINILPDLPRMEVETLRIPAAIGIGFGVLVLLEPEAVREVTVTVTHPPYPDTGIETETWVTTLDGIDPSLNGFTFDRASELVPGTWTFSAAAGDEVLYAIAFEVVAEAEAPGLASLCGGVPSV